jgi:hypothetical protein
VAAAVDRALEKDPEHRFPTMDAFAAELEACLAELDRGEDGGATIVIPALRRHRHRKRVSGWPVGIAALALLAVAAIVVGLLTLGGSGGENQAVGTPIELVGSGAYDPYGDGSEHDDDVASATDKLPATYWTTERYNDDSLGKPGVGIVLDAHGVVELSRITVVSDTPGFVAQIRATSVPGGTPQPVSDERIVEGRTTFDIDQQAPKRYWIIWITKLPPDSKTAHVNEVRAFGT